MLRILVLVFGGVFLLLISGCEPRGESKSVEQVYEIAKSRVESALLRSSTAHKDVVERVIQQVVDVVESLNPVDLRILGESLMKLYQHASPTVKVPLYHQADACINLGERGNLKKTEIMLLASRIFNILSSELETTGFGYRY